VIALTLAEGLIVGWLLILATLLVASYVFRE
jgi:hypothetical protein